MNPRQVLNIATASRSFAERLAKMVKPGQFYPGFTGVADRIHEGLQMVIQSTVINYPKWQRAAKRGDAHAVYGLQALQQSNLLFALQSCRTVLALVLTEKFNRDLELQAPTLLATAAGLGRNVEIFEQQLRQLKDAGLPVDTSVASAGNTVEFAEFDIPLLFMTEETAQEKFKATKTEIAIAIRLSERCLATMETDSKFVSETQGNFQRLLALVDAIVDGQTEERLLREYEKQVTLIGPLALYEKATSLYLQAIAELAETAAPVCAAWGCPGLEATILNSLKDERKDTAAKPGKIFGDEHLERMRGVENLLLDLACQHALVSNEIPEGVSDQFALGKACSIMGELQLAHDQVFAGETIGANMDRQRSLFVQADATIGAVVLEGVRRNMANNAGLSVMGAQGTIGHWLYFLALQPGLFSDKKEDLSRRVEELLLSFAEAYDRIARAGPAFNRVTKSREPPCPKRACACRDPEPLQEVPLEVAHCVFSIYRQHTVIQHVKKRSQFMDLARILGLIVACRDAIDGLAQSLPDGESRSSFIEASESLDRGFRDGAKSSLFLYPILQAASLKGNLPAQQGLRAYESTPWLFSRVAYFTTLITFLREKFNQDWQSNSQSLVATGAIFDAFADSLEQLLTRLEEAGFFFDSDRVAISVQIETAEFDIPLSQMSDAEISKKFQRSRAEIQTAIQSLQRCLRAVGAVDCIISAIRDKLRQLRRLAAAAIDQNTLPHDRRGYEKALVSEEQTLRLISRFQAMYEDALLQIGPTIAPICAEWGCPGVESTLLSYLIEPVGEAGMPAVAKPYRGLPFFVAPIERIQAAEAALIALLHEDGQLRTETVRDINSEPAVGDPAQVLASLAATYVALTACRNLGATLQHQRGKVAAAGVTVQSMIIDGVRLDQANRAALAVFAAQATIGNWFLVLAKQGRQFHAKAEVAARRVSELQRLFTAAHNGIANVGLSLGLAKLSALQEHEIVVINTGEAWFTETVREQAVSQCMADNTLTRSGENLTEQFMNLIEAIEASESDSQIGVTAAQLRQELGRADSVLETAYRQLASLNDGLVQLLRQAGFVSPAKAAEAMF